ncbi:MAG: hypothetical protein JST54_13850 [Deltaproteobacteria bacterium]|nr:hypothetical protein [Deltaproteobacteria bacterium]
MNRLEDEIRACEQALQRNPRDADALLRLSGLLVKKGDRDAAAGCLWRAAHLCDEGGVAAEAVGLLKQALRLNPRRLDILDDLAKHHAEAGERIEALRCLEKLLEARAFGHDAAATVDVLGRIRKLEPMWRPKQVV